ncbi:hypothetical protein GCM10009712_39710 [Pseudarthrobacter sulfonivorans]
MAVRRDRLAGLRIVLLRRLLALRVRVTLRRLVAGGRNVAGRRLGAGLLGLRDFTRVAHGSHCRRRALLDLGTKHGVKHRAPGRRDRGAILTAGRRAVSY